MNASRKTPQRHWPNSTRSNPTSGSFARFSKPHSGSCPRKRATSGSVPPRHKSRDSVEACWRRVNCPVRGPIMNARPAIFGSH